MDKPTFKPGKGNPYDLFKERFPEIPRDDPEIKEIFGEDKKYPTIAYVCDSMLDVLMITRFDKWEDIIFGDKKEIYNFSIYSICFASRRLEGVPGQGLAEKIKKLRSDGDFSYVYFDFHSEVERKGLAFLRIDSAMRNDFKLSKANLKSCAEHRKGGLEEKVLWELKLSEEQEERSKSIEIVRKNEGEVNLL